MAQLKVTVLKKMFNEDLAAEYCQDGSLFRQEHADAATPKLPF